MKSDGSSKDDSCLLWTCGLMAIIIVSLAVLWVHQRRQTQRVANRLARVLADQDRLKKAFQAAQLPPGSIPPPKPTGIDAPVTLNGQEVTARLVAPEVGISLGLGRGDVLIVADFNPADSPDGAETSE